MADRLAAEIGNATGVELDIAGADVRDRHPFQLRRPGQEIERQCGRLEQQAQRFQAPKAQVRAESEVPEAQPEVDRTLADLEEVLERLQKHRASTVPTIRFSLSPEMQESPRARRRTFGNKSGHEARTEREMPESPEAISSKSGATPSTTAPCTLSAFRSRKQRAG